jgi:hypothetical protein
MWLNKSDDKKRRTKICYAKKSFQELFAKEVDNNDKRKTVNKKV